MSDFVDSGVSTEVGTTSAFDGSTTSTAVPQTATPVQTNNAGETAQVGELAHANPPVESAAPPASAQPEDIPENDDDLQVLPEKERTPLLNQRARLRELNAQLGQLQPVNEWVSQRGGLEPIQADVQAVDGLLAQDVDTRFQAYTYLASQDATAWSRIRDDFANDPDFQAYVDQIRGFDPSAQQAQQMQGIARPEDLARELTPVYDHIASTNPELREELDLMRPAVRDHILKQQASELQREMAQAKAAQAERFQQIEQYKGKTYQNVRTVATQAVTSLFPNQPELAQMVVNAAESALYSSSDGAALWGEITALIDRGQIRAVSEKLPQLIAKAQTLTKGMADKVTGMADKARQLDELMRLVGPDGQTDLQQLAQQIQKLRGGGGREPRPGVAPPATPVNNTPVPGQSGRYDPANIIALHPLHRR